MSIPLYDEFACSLNDYWERVFLTEDYQRSLHLEGLGFHSYRCLEHRETEDLKVLRSIEVAGVPGLPSLVQRLVPGGGYVERGSLDRRSNRWTFRIEPAGMAGRIQIHGRVEVEALGLDRCLRSGEIVVDVRLPGVGSRVTKALTALTVANEDKSVRFTHRFVAALV
jgi:hypothetical protein